MPLKAGIIKTYGRHKFRRVKADLWVSPESECDEIFRSPVAKKERIPSRFEGTSTFRNTRNKLWAQPLTCTNMNKSKWDLPCKKPQSTFTCSKAGKENSNFWDQNKSAGQRNDNKPRRISSKSMATPALARMKNSLSYRTPCMTTEENVGALAYETPERDEEASEDGSIIYVQDSFDRTNSLREYEPITITISSCEKSLSKTDEPKHQPGNNQNVTVLSDDSPFCNAKHVHFSSSSTLFLNSNVLVSPLVNDKVTMRRSKPSGVKYITSTPLDAIVSRNNYCSSGWDLSGGRKPESTSKESTMFLSDCQVVIQPIQITPTLQRSLESAVAKQHSLEIEGALDPAALGVDKDEVTRSPHSPPSSKVSSLPKQSEEASSETPGEIDVNSQQGLLLKECVVSLERLRLTPLVRERKRSAASGPRPCVQTNSSHSPQRSSQCHLSFTEALTPARKSSHADVEDKNEGDKPELTPVEKVLLECEQETPITFKQYLKPSVLSKCVKIGEGVYGEVFKTTNTKRQQVALKIIPVEGDFPVNGEPQKSFEEMLPEIVISRELSALNEHERELKDNATPNFIRVQKVSCCQGRYPAKLLKQWDKWDKENNSENDRPDFPDDQLFIVFEFANGGRDLERFEFDSPSEALSVLHQTAMSLAVAENVLEFEHRDLHWGNVLINRTAQETVEYRLNGEDISMDTHGVFVSVIDFTLSRLNKENLTVFGNLAEDESLFTGKGDYQFDIYRLMRKANKNEWEHFEPYTNVLWLHYLADKMLKNKNYAVQEKGVVAKMKRFLRQARRYKSATEMIEDGVLS